MVRVLDFFFFIVTVVDMFGSHTYCEGTFVKRDSSRLVQKHYPGIKVFNNANILLDPGATPHCIKYADGSEYSRELCSCTLLSGTNALFHRYIPRDGQVMP